VVCISKFEAQEYTPAADGRERMKDFAGLGHLFVVAFLFHFSSFMVLPSITDVTMDAVCPGRDECSVAIYLSGFQNAVSAPATSRPSRPSRFAVAASYYIISHWQYGIRMQITGLGALVVTPVVGNLSDKYGRKALMTLPVTVAILPLGMQPDSSSLASLLRIVVHIETLDLTLFVLFSQVILACNRSEVYFYVYYVVKIVAGIFCEGSMHCLSLAYVVKYYSY
jgi:MFS family permease